MNRNIVVSAAPAPSLPQREVEMCEHKGVGHPDTLTDGACEAAGVALAQAYLKHFGAIQHFNVDKGLLVGGQSRPRFGGGEIIVPFKLIVCGRASNPGHRLDLEQLVHDAAMKHLRASIRSPNAKFSVSCELREGSVELQNIYAANSVSVANDTSFGVGYAPLSALEKLTLQAAAVLRSKRFRQTFVAAGDDFKLMAVRRGDAMSITVALAMMDAHIHAVRDYYDVKHAVAAYLRDELGANCDVAVNALDDPDTKDERGLYLTVSGVSAEMGDDGQVGRGNRVNGLITPGRTMSLEAAAGKNPRSHVGKIYNVLAKHIAERICAEIAEVSEATVQLVSRIGTPVDQPWAALAEVNVPRELTGRVHRRVSELVENELARVHEWTERLSRGEHQVY